MAFRIQDPATGLFWKLDGKNILLAEVGDEFTENADGIIDVVTLSSRVYSLPRDTEWRFTQEGYITRDDYHYIVADTRQKRPMRSLEKHVWTKVGGDALRAAPTPVAVPEPEPEVPEPEPEVEEDVPVTHGAALIEEALNAQAEDAVEEDE